MIHTIRVYIMVVLLVLVVGSSCRHNEADPALVADFVELSPKSVVESRMQMHLDAVTNRDLATLKKTLHPEGKIQLILPGMEIVNGVDGFMDFHAKWFAASTEWSFETKILNSEVGNNFAMVITELTYREPMRDGKPYYNRQVVSYVLENVEGQWFVIKDHCSSTEKSTDER